MPPKRTKTANAHGNAQEGLDKSRPLNKARSLEKPHSVNSQDGKRGNIVHRLNSLLTTPEDADSRIPKGSKASFDQLMEQLHGLLTQLKVWGQQEGFGTSASQVELEVTSDKQTKESSLTELAKSPTCGKPDDQTEVESTALAETVRTEEKESVKEVPPTQAQPEAAVGHMDLVMSMSNTGRHDEQTKDSELRLCEVWESKEGEALDPVQFATPHGRLRRLSSRTFFGNVNDVRGHEKEAWETALSRKNKPEHTGPVHPSHRLIFTPYSKWRAIWEVGGVSLLVWDMFFIPFQTFLPNNPDHALINVLEVLSMVYWALDVLASFAVGFYRAEGMVEMRPVPIAKHYLATWFFYDIVCVCTDYVLHFFKGAARTVSLIRGFRMLRLLRVLKLHKRLRNSIRRIQSNQILIILHIAKNISLVLAANHMTACGWHWIGKKYHLSDASWVEHWLLVEGDSSEPVERSLSYRYFTCLHWAITQLGVGAVEIHPMNSGERAFAALTGILALIMTSVLVSSVTTSMVQLQELHRQEAKEDQALRQYLHNRCISQRLQSHLWAFLKRVRKQTKVTGITESDVEAIMRLPSHLSLALRMEVYMPIMIYHPFFSKQFTEVGTGGSHGKTTRDFIGILREMKVNHEEDLFRTGDKATKMQFVVVGEILYKSRLDSSPHGTKLGSHDWLAEQALWLKWVHVGRAVAVKGCCEVFVLDTHQFQKIMVNEHSAKLYAMLFLQRILGMSEPVTDVMGMWEKVLEWQREISLLAFNIQHSNVSRKLSALHEFM